MTETTPCPICGRTQDEPLNVTEHDETQERLAAEKPQPRDVLLDAIDRAFGSESGGEDR